MANTPLDEKLPSKILALIERFGVTGTFYRVGDRTYNVTTGAGNEAGITESTAKVTPPSPYEERYIDGSTVLIGDAKTFVAPQLFEIEIGMRVKIYSQEWKVINRKPLYSGELIAAIELQLRL